MVFLGVKNADHSLNFFRLLTLLTELSGGPAGKLYNEKHTKNP